MKAKEEAVDKKNIASVKALTSSVARQRKNLFI